MKFWRCCWGGVFDMVMGLVISDLICLMFLINFLSFRRKGLIAQQPQPICRVFTPCSLTLISWWSVGTSGFSIDQTEALFIMFSVV